MEHVLVAIRAIADLEAKLLLTKPWTVDHPEYKVTLDYIQLCDFHHALNKIQQLVVQRLFEVSKANLSGMGYKLRTSIWKALKSRSKAINTALVRYNKLAPLMNPPAPTLEWKQLMEYSFVSEFELLRHSQSHQDITKEVWTIHSHREITTKYFKVLRAHKEIHRVNIEMCRLRTAIRDEHMLFELHIQRLQVSDPLLAAEIQERYNWRVRVNTTHTRRLDCIEALSGFTGVCGPGTHRGVMAVDAAEPEVSLGIPSMADQANISSAERTDGVQGIVDRRVADDDEADGDDDLEEQVAGLSEALAVEPMTQGVPSSMLSTWSSTQ